MTIPASGSTADEARLARLLFGDLAEELDLALTRSTGGTRGLALEKGSPAQIDRLLDAAARDIREGELGRAAFEGFAAPQAQRLERAFVAARTIASWAGLELPEPEAFWSLGVDRVAITRALLADSTLVLVPAPHGLGEARWTQLFRTAARQPGSALSLGTPLTLAPEVSTAFDALDAVPENVRALSIESRDRAVTGRFIAQWTIRLIPAAAFPPRTDVSHLLGPHPTLPEMLMLQLMQCATGKEPVDRHSFTWLDGTFTGGRFAARHFFDAVDGSVGVNAREIGNQGPHLGVRPPVGN